MPEAQWAAQNHMLRARQSQWDGKRTSPPIATAGPTFHPWRFAGSRRQALT